MKPLFVYLFVGLVVVLLIVAALLLPKQNEQKKLTPLAGIAFIFIIAGILFGDDRWIAYSLLGIGIVLSVWDIIRKLKQKNVEH